MNPILTVTAGPRKGENFSLTGDVFSIGREPTNHLCIREDSISRRHCLLKNEAGHFKIIDLNSQNGTFVNGVPTKEHLLEHGDQIKLGDSSFLFLLHEGEVEPTVGVLLDDASAITGPTVGLRPEDALYLHPERVEVALPTTARMARDLSALLKISTTINSIHSLPELQKQLLELTFDVVPAERGAILLVSEGSDELASVGRWNTIAEFDRPVQASLSIVRRVLREGVALLANDIGGRNAKLTSTGSLLAYRVQSLLCVPMVIFKKTLGVIYLDTTNTKVAFDEDHLQLLTAIASFAAVALENARRVEWLENENRRLNEDLNIEHDMVGDSPRMREVYQFIGKVAPTNSTVLIRGESGTGKEQVARAIHVNSPRAGKPFVALNCAALTETLLESELFGHERGAFTGAVAQKKGKLEVADGGTVFLDEVAEMAAPLQSKLLRVLQEREFERVGGTRPIKIDIRLVAATNKDLEEAIRTASFRQDLFYRLNVVSLSMPPLRERREDIPVLATHFAAKFSKQCKSRTEGISADARACLLNYDWPGNVRELENAIERAVVLGSGDLIRPEDLPETILETEPPSGAPVTKYHEAIKEAKKQLIMKAVEQAGGNYTEAARLLGVHSNYLHRLIRNLNLKDALKKLAP
jgi:Nif-specific regulatory protein